MQRPLKLQLHLCCHAALLASSISFVLTFQPASEHPLLRHGHKHKEAPDTVHVVFSNHLDIGFDGIDPVLGSDDNVINTYFDNYIPAAIDTAQQLRDLGGTERYIYLTHSYLVSLYLDCPPGMGFHCPNTTTQQVFADAILRGDITWHAFPHNAQLELFDEQLLWTAFDLSHALDQKFGLPLKMTMSQRDVPGLTRAAIPIMADKGVSALTVGVNSGSAPPDVPLITPFIWRDEPSGKEVVAMWHPGGYSGVPVDVGDGCVQAPGFGHILCGAWRGDNAGPHNVSEVLNIFGIVRDSFPHANVIASTLDAFAAPLLDAAPRLHLPVVTAEIGDTWIYGAASDADKVAEFRAILRMRRKLEDHFQEASFQNFSRILLKVPEHTWGVDIKKALGDYRNWSNADFQAALDSDDIRYTDTVDSWVRQRGYMRWSLEALGSSEAGLAMWGALARLQGLKAAPLPRQAGFQQLRIAELRPLSSHAWTLEINPDTGALSGLRYIWGGERQGGNWAGLANPLGAVVYSTYTEADYDTIWDNYMYMNNRTDWFAKDFGKPNCSLYAEPRRADEATTLEEVWVKQEDEGLHVMLRQSLPAWAVEEAGAPAELWTEILSPPGSANLYYDVVWVNKTATRLPEALWVRWVPPLAAADPASWRLHKLGSAISPHEVVRNGSRAMHAVQDAGVSVAGADELSWEQLNIRSLDAALVSPGDPTPFPVLDALPDMQQGVSFNLANNIWGTNYVMWQPYSPEAVRMRFRFVLQMADLSDPARPSLAEMLAQLEYDEVSGDESRPIAASVASA